MKRKLGLARAILHDPEVLFFDEPSSGLDPEAQHMVRELILRLSERRSITVFLNSHNLDEVQRVCSRVAILHRGQIQALDTVRHLTLGAGTTGVRITLADSSHAKAALSIARSFAGVIDAVPAGDRLTVTMEGNAASPLISHLVQAGIGVEEAVKVERSLEEIYLDVMKQGDDA
jgi:ABC-2 type transport system ATP-binding protein